MPFSTDTGLFARLYRWRTDRDNDVNILASRMDAEFDGVKDAINAIHEGTGTNYDGFLGPLKGSFGTELEPGLSFRNDKDTGLYRHRSNELGVSLGGSLHLLMAHNVFRWQGYDIWHKGNDGDGSGLDADLHRGMTPQQVADLQAHETAEQLLAKIKTVDGGSSGLDADTVDGYEASEFVSNTDLQTAINSLTSAAGSTQNVAMNQAVTTNNVDLVESTSLWTTLASVTITPNKNTSRVLVQAEVNFDIPFEKETRVNVRLVRGSLASPTVLANYDGVEAGIPQRIWAGTESDYNDINTKDPETVYITVPSAPAASSKKVRVRIPMVDLDNPASAAQLTYRIQAQRTSGSDGAVTKRSANILVIEQPTKINVGASAINVSIGGTNVTPETGTTILNKLLTVDGASSNLDADLLDGEEGSHYAVKETVDEALAALMQRSNANQARLAVLEVLDLDSDTPRNDVSIGADDDWTANDNGLAPDFTKKIGDNLVGTDLMVIEWENFIHLNIIEDHVIHGSTATKGTLYAYVQHLNGQIGGTSGTIRTDAAGGTNYVTDPLGSTMHLTMHFDSGTLNITGKRGVIGNANDQPAVGKFPSNFKFNIKVYRPT